ncbi:DUF4148 domain-containing protein [Burkholderia sp. Ac-20379]|uniref:DUF4148 domain-containing protein n=1 Tax=Burkholderia sp. Ac-20379 TaxID=2703900 RepID=UPI00197FD881|nr:DUF4148 domain-containing protein [Burkholderia sp. Ac-20379]
MKFAASHRIILAAAGLVAMLGAASAPAFADGANHAITRADVRAQLVELEQAGYNPAGYDGRLHRRMEEAEAVIAQRRAAAAASKAMVLEASAPQAGRVMLQASK